MDFLGIRKKYGIAYTLVWFLFFFLHIPIFFWVKHAIEIKGKWHYVTDFPWPQCIKGYGNLAGYYTIYYFGILLLFVWRSNPLYRFTSLSYQGLLLVHRTAGWCCFWSIVFHSLCYVIYWVAKGTEWTVILKTKSLTGFGCLFFFFPFALFSTAANRRLRYEVFSLVHWFWIPILALAFAHTWIVQIVKNDDETTYHSYSDMFLIYLAGPGIFLYISDKVFRVYTTMSPVKTVVVSTSENHILLKLSRLVTRRQALSYKKAPFLHAFLYCEESRPLYFPWHPFSVASLYFPPQFSPSVPIRTHANEEKRREEEEEGNKEDKWEKGGETEMEEEIIEEEDSGWWGGWERWGGNDFEEDEEEGAVKVVEKKRQRVGRRRLVEVEFTFIVKRSERKRWTDATHRLATSNKNNLFFRIEGPYLNRPSFNPDKVDLCVVVCGGVGIAAYAHFIEVLGHRTPIHLHWPCKDEQILQIFGDKISQIFSMPLVSSQIYFTRSNATFSPFEIIYERPNIEEIIEKSIESLTFAEGKVPELGVVCCGPSSLVKEVERNCFMKREGIKIHFEKERFHF